MVFGKDGLTRAFTGSGGLWVDSGMIDFEGKILGVQDVLFVLWAADRRTEAGSRKAGKP